MDGANNTNAAATAAAKIGENQIRTAQDTLRKYKQGKARLEKRIIASVEDKFGITLSPEVDHI